MFSLSEWKNKIIHIKEMKTHKDGVFILAWYTFILFIILTIVTVSVVAGGKVKGKEKAPLALGNRSKGGGNESGGKDAREDENQEVDNNKAGRTASNTGTKVNSRKTSQNRNSGNKRRLRAKQNIEAEEAEAEGEPENESPRVNKRRNNSSPSKYVPGRKKQKNEMMADQEIEGESLRGGGTGNKKNALRVQPVGAKRNSMQKQKSPGGETKKKTALGKQKVQKEGPDDVEEEVEPKPESGGESYSDGSELSPFKFVFWNEGRNRQENGNSRLNEDMESEKEDEQEIMGNIAGGQQNFRNVVKKGKATFKPKQKISGKVKNKGKLGVKGDNEKKPQPEEQDEATEAISTGIFNLLWGRNENSRQEMDADDNANVEENTDAEIVDTENLPTTSENEETSENNIPAVATNEDNDQQTIEPEEQAEGGNEEQNAEEIGKGEVEVDQSETNTNMNNFFQVVWKAPSTKGSSSVNSMPDLEGDKLSTSDVPADGEETVANEVEGSPGMEEVNGNDAVADVEVEGETENGQGAMDEGSANNVEVDDAFEARNENEAERGFEGGNGDAMEGEGGDDGENSNINQFMTSGNMLNRKGLFDRNMNIDRTPKYQEKKHHHHHHHHEGGANMFGNGYGRNSYFKRPPPPPPPPPVSQRQGKGKQKIAFKRKPNSGPRSGSVPNGRNDDAKRRGKG